VRQNLRDLDFVITVGPRYMREIGTPKIGSNIMNSHLKRPRMTVNKRIGSRKKAISGSHICEIADKKMNFIKVIILTCSHCVMKNAYLAMRLKRLVNCLEGTASVPEL